MVKYSRYQDKGFPYLVDLEYSPRYSAYIHDRQRYDLAGLTITNATRLINEIRAAKEERDRTEVKSERCLQDFLTAKSYLDRAKATEARLEARRGLIRQGLQALNEEE